MRRRGQADGFITRAKRARSAHRRHRPADNPAPGGTPSRVVSLSGCVPAALAGEVSTLPKTRPRETPASRQKNVDVACAGGADHIAAFRP